MRRSNSRSSAATRRRLQFRHRLSSLESLESRRLMAVLPPEGDLAEGNASAWVAFADGATATVTDDATRVRVGSQSIKLDTQGGFDTGVILNAPAERWDLSRFNYLDFWVYGENPHPPTWQGNQPVIELTSPAGSLTLAPDQQLMPNHAWARINVPLEGDDIWQRTIEGTFDQANVTSLEIHQDTWDFGFAAWYDGVQFDFRTPLDSPVLEGPRGMAVDSNGRAIVAESDAHRVRIMNAAGDGVLLVGSQGSGNGQFETPADIAVVAGNQFYVVDSGNHRIQAFQPNGSFLSKFGSQGAAPGQFNAPEGIGYDAFSGKIYVADSGNHRVQRFLVDGTLDTSWGGDGVVGTTGTVLRDHTGFDRPSDVAVNPITDEVYVADFGNHRIEVFDASGNYVRTYLAVYRPHQLAFDTVGNLYIAGEDPNESYTAYDGRLRFLQVGDDLISRHYTGGVDDLGRTQRGVAVRPDGRVLVADTLNSRIVKVEPSFELPISDVAVDANGTSVTVTWTTPQPGPSKVEIGGVIASDSTITRHHAVTVAGLTPNTRAPLSIAFADTFTGDEAWTKENTINTGAPAGQTDFLRVKAAGLVYTDSVGSGYAKLPQAQIDSMRDRFLKVAEYYWRNSGFKLWLDFTILEVDRDLASGQDLFPLQQPDLEAAGFTAADNFDAIYSVSPITFANLGGGGGAFNRLIASAIWVSQSDFVAIHEINHSIDALYGHSGLSQYEFNHGIWAVPGGMGHDFAVNGQILRNMLPANFTAAAAPFTKVMTAPDADNDGLPDSSPAGLTRPLPITEATLGGSTSSRDSDDDGLNDLDEAKVLTNTSSNLNAADSDADGVRDGVDLNPLYKMNELVHRGSPAVDGSIGPGEGWSVLTDQWGFSNTSLVTDNDLRQATTTTYAAWDDNYLYLALKGAPGLSRVLLDGGADNIFFGSDNYHLRFRNNADFKEVAVNVGLPDIFRQIDNDGQFSEFFDTNPQFSLPYQGRTIFNNPGDGLGFAGRLVTEADLLYQRGGSGNDSVWEVRIPWSDATQLRGFAGKEMGLFVGLEGDKLFETDHQARIRLVDGAAPVLTLGGNAVYRENAGPTLLAPRGTVVDFDNFDLQGGALTVAITAGIGPTDRLEIRNEGTAAGQIGIAGDQVKFGGRTMGTYSGGNGTPLVVTFNLNATPQSAQALLQSITFRASGDAPRHGGRNVRFTLSDGDGHASVANMTLSVVAKNDRPVVGSFGGDIGYRENAQPSLLSTTVTVTDVDNATYNGGTLRVTLTSGSQPTDRLLIVPNARITATASTVSYQGVVIGTYTAGSGATPLVFTFNNKATPAKIQALLRRIGFEHVGDNPIARQRRVVVQLTDPAGAVSVAVSKRINVVPKNDAPLLTGGGSVGYQLGAPAVLVASTFTISDPDSFNFADGKLRVHITEGKHASNRLQFSGGFTLSGNDVVYGGEVIGTKNPGGGEATTALVITFDADATRSIVQSLLRSIKFRATGGNFSRTVSFLLTDGDGGTSNTVLQTVNVTPS